LKTINYKLPIETSRWNNIDRANIICTKCDNITIGDEYHYIIECQHLKKLFYRFIITNLQERPTILKFKQIMSASQKQIKKKLCKFVQNINKSFVLTALSLLYIFYIYVYINDNLRYFFNNESSF
jgi:hypothetical protein